MNTPPKRKRYEKPRKPKFRKDWLFVGTISDAEVNKQFSNVMTGFVYLEERMASVLAVLMGSNDTIAASYVLKAIRSPAGRVDIMKELLEKAPINKKLGDEYDHIIKEFRAISAERNLYAHGRWWTDAHTNETILDETEDLTTELVSRRVVTPDDIKQLDERMLELHMAIASGPEAELAKRRKASRRRRRAPSPSTRPRRTSQK